MARIAGINIPLNKRAEIGLTYIYGVGRSTANNLLAETGIEPDRKVRDLTDDEVGRSCATPSTATSPSRAICAASATRTSSA